METNEQQTKNFNFLKDQIKYLGFEESQQTHKLLNEKLNSKEKNFTISIPANNASFANKVTFDLNFIRSVKSDMVFLNSYKAILTNEKQNKNIEHLFLVKQGGITAKQAVNLLEGRAVKTEVRNQYNNAPEEAFIKLKLNEQKGEYGNYKIQVFNKNYGIDTPSIMEKAKLIFQNDKHKDITLKSLEKGNIVSVKFKNENNEITEGKAILNPQYKSLNLYDTNMKRINTNENTLLLNQNDKTQAKEYNNSRTM